MNLFCFLLKPVIACSLITMVPLVSGGADRVALVIGIDRYDHLPGDSQLDVAVRDARLMSDTLEQLSPPFSVRLLTDVRQRDAMENLTEFVHEAEGAECVLVYFAGHGVEYHGSNYLLARDTRVSRVSADVELMKRRLGLAALPLQAIVDELDGTGAQVKIVILDACRDNPIQVDNGSGTRSVFGARRGLAQVTAPSGALISFSADSGQRANDGLFTQVLARNLKQPGLPLPHVFALTREEVKREATELRKRGLGVFHEPAEYTKLNVAGMKFSFVPGSPGNAPENTELLAMRRRIEQLEREKRIAESNEWKTRGFVNSLGMRFLPVPGTTVLFCEHETRVKDYAAFADEIPDVADDWKNVVYEGNRQSEDHPVVNVRWEDAKRFCEWLSRRENRRYRLPTDLEWSFAAGIGAGEDPDASPEERERRNLGYPWKGPWPPPGGTGNYLEHDSEPEFWTGKRNGYRDSHPFTAPVKSYRKGPNGLYDLSGNVSEWCEDWWDYRRSGRVLRGGSWRDDAWEEGKDYLTISVRNFSDGRYGRSPGFHTETMGFRCVVETSN